MRLDWRSTSLLLTATALFAFSLLQDRSASYGDDETARAQESESEETPRRMLPFNYGKLALSDEQRERVYGIQADYADRIDALLLQIEELRAQRDAEMETVLTPGQRLRLAELREEAQREAESAATPDDQPETPNP